jgi:small subunit ribosomal protein S19
LKGRSAWKGPYIDHTLLNPEPSFYKNFKIMSRASVIPMSMIGQNVLIHNGQVFKKVLITREKVGYKFGEFSFTRQHTHKEKAAIVNGAPKAKAK